MPGPRATRGLLGVTSAVIVGALGAAGSSATAAKGPSVDESPLLWATVNICDTKSHPDTIGIRGSMPGSGISGEQMFMRFQVQFFDRRDGKWHNIGASGDSGFVPVGSAKFRQRQSGRNYVVTPPRTGSFVLRGAVTFQWRKDGDVVRRARKQTSAKRGPTAGADPSGFSASRCDVRR